ncbi:hypothetical protein HDU97_004411 [Phlyctochytrium planicorne]|nr:hypothetical protein HDU97_004411 [Phlyctochytrium planicorne]
MARIRIGHAIGILQEDIPNFFETGLTDTNIYHSSLMFRDPCHEQLSHIVIKGKSSYLISATVLRWLLRIYYDSIDIDIIRMTQYRGPAGGGKDGQENGNGDVKIHINEIDVDRAKTTVAADTAVPGSLKFSENPERLLENEDPEDTSVRLMVRWVFEAVPRHQALLASINPLYVKPSVFEGVFVYRFSDQGYIVEHVLQSVYPCPPLLAMCRWWFKGNASQAGGSGAEVPTLHP